MKLPVPIPDGWQELFDSLDETNITDLQYTLAVIEMAGDELSEWFPSEFVDKCSDLAAWLRQRLRQLEIELEMRNILTLRLGDLQSCATGELQRSQLKNC